MVKDPVCGMTVNDNSKFSSVHAGTTYVFCSASCKAKFDKEPTRYAQQAGGAGPSGGPHHQCC